MAAEGRSSKSRQVGSRAHRLATPAWLRRILIAAPLAGALCACTGPHPDLKGLRADEIDYNWHVRPILSENCFKCHGPDPSSREAGLRLDLGELATAELPETPGKYAIVPGDASRSELVRRIRSQNVDERMPPESTHKTLSAQQMAILEQWIENGAEYRPHWAFIEAERPAVPETALAQHAANDIDRFVLEPPRARGPRAVRARRQRNA